MQAIFMAWYNRSRKHETLRGGTSAMAAGLTNQIWTITDFLERASAA